MYNELLRKGLPGEVKQGKSRMNTPFRLWLVVMPMLVLYGCPSQPPKPVQAPVVEERTPPPVKERGPTPVEVAPGPGPGTIETEPAGQPLPFQGHPLDNPDNLLAQRVVYFDFDSSEIRDEFQGVIAAHAVYLSENLGAQLSLEGHTDERGSREYNLALGEQRAKAVAQLLILQGAFPNQVEVVSFGEERPVTLGHDESAWQLNRRVEILYLRR